MIIFLFFVIFFSPIFVQRNFLDLRRKFHLMLMLRTQTFWKVSIMHLGQLGFSEKPGNMRYFDIQKNTYTYSCVLSQYITFYLTTNEFCLQGQNVDFRNQLKNHQKLVSRLVKVLGNETLAKERLNKCLYWVELGNNDYINNYYLPDIYPSSSIYTPQQFANLLIDNHRDKLQVIN